MSNSSMGSNKIKEAFSELHLMGDILLYDTIRKWNHRYCSNIGISEDNYTNNAAERLKQSSWYILLESMTIIMFDNILYFTLILMVESDWLFECGVTSVIKHAAERVFYSSLLFSIFLACDSHSETEHVKESIKLMSSSQHRVTQVSHRKKRVAMTMWRWQSSTDQTGSDTREWITDNIGRRDTAGLLYLGLFIMMII